MKATAILAVSLVGAAALAVAARQNPPVPPPHYEPAAEPGASLEMDGELPESDSSVIQGDVREAFDVAQYTYLRLGTTNGETWAAVSRAPVNVGQRVQIEHAARMDNFTSNTLKRTFPVIYFGELAGAAAGQLPPGHPAVAGAPHDGPNQERATPELPPARVERAAGKNGHTIAELYTERATLEGRLVRVSGQVVKVTSGVLGKNYVRLRDGSTTEAERRELVVTTQAEVQPGDVVTLEGTLRRDVDVGIGYKYPLLLADAAALTRL